MENKHSQKWERVLAHLSNLHRQNLYSEYIIGKFCLVFNRAVLNYSMARRIISEPTV